MSPLLLGSFPASSSSESSSSAHGPSLAFCAVAHRRASFGWSPHRPLQLSVREQDRWQVDIKNRGYRQGWVHFHLPPDRCSTPSSPAQSQVQSMAFVALWNGQDWSTTTVSNSLSVPLLFCEQYLCRSRQGRSPWIVLPSALSLRYHFPPLTSQPLVATSRPLSFIRTQTARGLSPRPACDLSFTHPMLSPDMRTAASVPRINWRSLARNLPELAQIPPMTSPACTLQRRRLREGSVPGRSSSFA